MELAVRLSDKCGPCMLRANICYGVSVYFGSLQDGALAPGGRLAHSVVFLHATHQLVMFGGEGD